MVGQVHREGAHLGDVLGGEGLVHARVDLLRGLLVPAEAVEGELRGVHEARGDLDDAHVVLGLLEPQRLRHGPLGELRGVVAAAALVGPVRGEGREVQDGALAVGAQRREEGAGQAHRAEHVDLVHPLPVLGAGLGHAVRAAGAAGDVEQRVHAALLLQHLVPEGLDVGVRGDVARRGHGPRLAGQGLEPFGAAGHRVDGPAGPAQLARGGLPDAGRRAGDDGDPAGVRGGALLIGHGSHASRAPGAAQAPGRRGARRGS